MKADWLLEDAKARNIKFEFLNIPDFLLNEETREINANELVDKILSINPQMTVMVICYSHILDLKFLLEGAGVFAEMRMNRDLNILTNGQILTMNEIQKDCIQTMAHEDNVEKDIIVEGPVGSGKTLMGVEIINIKKAHYKKKYGIALKDCQNKIRIIIWIGSGDQEMLKQQLLNEMSKSSKDCSLEIHSEFHPSSEKLESIFQSNENYKSFSQTIIMFDEITR